MKRIVSNFYGLSRVKIRATFHGKKLLSALDKF